MRPILAVVATSGVVLTLGVAQATAAQPAQPAPSAPGSSQSAPSSCVAAGYRAQAKVAYKRTPTETYISSISVNLDKRAGAHNKVRIVVKDEDKTVFYYASQPTVTAGPFLFDYTDNPIPTHQQSPSDQLTVDVTFDFDRGTGGSSASPDTASPETVSPDTISPDDATRSDRDGVEGRGDDQAESGSDVGDPGTSGNKKHHKHSDADPALFVTPGQTAAPARCTATVRF